MKQGETILEWFYRSIFHRLAISKEKLSPVKRRLSILFSEIVGTLTHAAPPTASQLAKLFETFYIEVARVSSN